MLRPAAAERASTRPASAAVVGEVLRRTPARAEGEAKSLGSESLSPQGSEILLALRARRSLACSLPAAAGALGAGIRLVFCKYPRLCTLH